jgi:hypothetical protein
MIFERVTYGKRSFVFTPPLVLTTTYDPEAEAYSAECHELGIYVLADTLEELAGEVGADVAVLIDEYVRDTTSKFTPEACRLRDVLRQRVHETPVAEDPEA